MTVVKKFYLLLIIAVLIPSCRKGSGQPFTFLSDELYVNSSDYDLEIQVYNSRFDPREKTYQLLINDTLALRVKHRYSDLEYDSGIVPIMTSDSVIISFGDRKSYFSIHTANNELNVLESENYSYEKISNSHDRYTYTFTNKDYTAAIPMAFDNLLGSVWRCTAGAGLQDGVRYNELRFVSNTTVEGWALTTEYPTPEHLFTATYTIANQTITISDGEDDFFVATLNETQDLVTNIDDEGECVNQRQ